MQGEPAEIQAAVQDVTTLNEELLDKLRILGYQKDYVQSKGNKPITLASFSVTTNPVDQFNVFKNLVKWLFGVNDMQGTNFSNYDDPMTVSTNILNQCKKLQIQCDFPPLKLKGGSGQHVLILLNQMASKAMKKKNFNFKTPKFQTPKAVEEQNDQEPKGKDDDNDEMIDEAEMIEQDEMQDRQQIGAAAIDQDKQIIHSAVNENDWKLECQRVANKLKIQSKADNKQWRAHIQSTKGCGDHVKKNFPKARAILQKLNDDLTKNLDKISKSERMINTNMSEIGQQYKSQSQQLKRLSTHYNNLNAAIKEMNENYRQISEKLEQIQAKTNEHSGNMTDSSPVVKIKESLKNILTEIKGMDVRMGVLSHTILQYKYNERNVNVKLSKNLSLQPQEFDEF